MPLPFDEKIEELKRSLLAMASHADVAVRRAIQALIERDEALASRVQQDDALLDRLEVEVDELALTLLAEAPRPEDLRFITIAMKISNDLERIGDEATTIARRAAELNAEPQLKPYMDIPRMATLASQMLKEAMESFVARDPVRARGVIPRDKEVDELNKQLHRELASFMIENRATINRSLHLMVIAKSLERIADHATNVAEEVVFLYEGADIRHNPAAKSGSGQT